MKAPLVSILIPVRNAMPYLEQCLDSIAEQTYTNWELIAVNDHSTDGSFDKLTAYATKDPRIKVVNNTAKGIISALRLAYSLSSGDLITRMDADDYMSLDKLALYVDSMQISDKGQVGVGLVQYISETVVGDGYRNYADWLNGLTINANNFKDIYKECVIPSPNWMLHRGDLDKIGAFEYERYPEDYDLAFRMYQAGFTINPIKHVTHYWRDHSTRASRNDPNYLDNRFLDIKLHYFLAVDHRSNMQISIWGAGKKGKYIARYLLDQDVDFSWLTDNPKKIGVDIYGKKLASGANFIINASSDTQFIIAIANKEDQKELKNSFGKLKDQSQVFWFC